MPCAFEASYESYSHLNYFMQNANLNESIVLFLFLS